MFTTLDGSPVNGTGLTHALQRYVAAAGLPTIRWHDLRHTWCSLALQAGVPLHTVQLLGGWSSYSVLLSTYAHLMPAQQVDAAERLEGVLAL